MIRIIRGIFGLDAPSVENILSSFSVMVAKLEKHRANMIEEMATHAVSIEELQAKLNAATDEASKAKNAAEKLNKFFEVK